MWQKAKPYLITLAVVVVGCVVALLIVKQVQVDEKGNRVEGGTAYKGTLSLKRKGLKK
jgi:hypothetical protein